MLKGRRTQSEAANCLPSSDCSHFTLPRVVLRDVEFQKLDEPRTNCKHTTAETQHKHHQYAEPKKVAREAEREMARWGNSLRGEYSDRGNEFMFTVHSLSSTWYNK